MSDERCWARQADGGRCPERVMRSRFFCPWNGGPGDPAPEEIYCLPEAAMPTGVVAVIRFANPGFVFPDRAPELISESPTGDQPGAARRDPSSESGALPATSSFPNDAAGPAGDAMTWLQSVLQQAMEGVMAGEAPPLQKASAIARLANLYLKAHRAGELERENRELTKRLEQMEQRLATVESDAADAEATAAMGDRPISTGRRPALSEFPRSGVLAVANPPAPTRGQNGSPAAVAGGRRAPP